MLLAIKEKITQEFVPTDTLVLPLFAVVYPDKLEVYVVERRNDGAMIRRNVELTRVPVVKQGRVMLPYRLMAELVPDPNGEFYPHGLYVSLRDAARALGMGVAWLGDRAAMFRTEPTFTRAAVEAVNHPSIN